jgi:hypothetical protein
MYITIDSSNVLVCGSNATLDLSDGEKSTYLRDAESADISVDK